MDSFEDIVALRADAQRALSERHALYDAAPEVTIVGLIGPSASGMGKIGQAKDWTWSLKFVAWRDASGTLRSEPLILERQVPDEDSERYSALVEAFDIVRVRAKLAVIPKFDSLRGYLLEVLKKDVKDEELSAVAAELQKPVIIEDEVFGTLTLERRLNWFSGVVKWGNVDVKVNLDGEDEESSRKALPIARAFWKRRDDWDRDAREKAVEELLDTKNGSWLEEGEKEVTPGEFKARMTPESVTVREDGSLDICYNDGDLFWGHVIIVNGTLDGGPEYAEMAG